MSDRRELARRLTAVEGFDDPSLEREQYPTPPDLAAHLLSLAALRDDVGDCTVLDLGTGTGVLALGAALLGPTRVVGVEVDPDALGVARENERRLAPVTRVEWVHGDVRRLPASADDPVTVVANPPFGAVDGRAGADRPFLAAAAAVAEVSYTVHNAGSESFVRSYAGDAGGDVTDGYAADLDVGRQFDHHERDRATLEVEVYRIDWR